jgi:predicted Zn-dependent protease
MEISRRTLLQHAAVASMATCCGCKTAPMTGRRQLMILPEGEEIALGVQAYNETLSKETPSTNQRFINLVQRVGNRIAAVSGRSDYQWEFRTIQSNVQNAFCLPGGKVAVYEGILPVCQNEAGLAVVMAHEVAHAFARHGGERMSQNSAIQLGKEVVGRITKTKVPQQHELLLQAYGVTTQLGSLSYNRKQESEADHIGVMLMAKAGYDPVEAPVFWRRFASNKSGDYTPEFLSTHPADERRARDLENLLPDANQHYAAAQQKLGRGESIIRTAS